MRATSDKAEDTRRVKLDALAQQQTNAAKSLRNFTIALVAVGALQVIVMSAQTYIAAMGRQQATQAAPSMPAPSASTRVAP
jgi:hypothetical protein